MLTTATTAMFYLCNIQKNKKIEKRDIEIDVLNKKIEELRTENDIVLGNLNHELRVQINSIMAMTEILEFTEPNKLQMNYLETIKESSNMIFETITNMEEMSKNYFSNNEIFEKEFDFLKIFEDIIIKYNKNCIVKDIEFLLDSELELKNIYFGDAGKIKKIIEMILGFFFKNVKNGKIIVKSFEKGKNNDKEVIELFFGNEESEIDTKSINNEEEGHTVDKRDSFYGIVVANKLANIIGSAINIENMNNGIINFSIKFEIKLVKKYNKNRKNRDKKALLFTEDKIKEEIIIKNMKKNSITVEVFKGNSRSFIDIIKNSIKDYDMIFVDYKKSGNDFFEIIKYLEEKDKIVLILNRYAFRENLRILNNFTMIKYIVNPYIDYDDFIEKFFIESKIIENENKENKSLVNRIEGRKILLVEDNKINQKTTKIMLEKANYIVEVASDGQEAVEKFQEQEFDLILMDIQMPVMNGFEASEEIRQKNKEVPIIALTAYALKGDRDKCIESGMNNYLAKPYKMQDLYEIIKKYSR
jgi:two-component system, sensor histidine kinase and response regulator